MIDGDYRPHAVSDVRCASYELRAMSYEPTTNPRLAFKEPTRTWCTIDDWWLMASSEWRAFLDVSKTLTEANSYSSREL
jgi:hypothetical protein